MDNFPAQLSGGTAACRYCSRTCKNPKLYCVTNLRCSDYNTGKQILRLLQDTCRNEGITVLLITHNSALAPMADRLIQFRNGKVTEITTNDHPMPIAEIEW